MGCSKDELLARLQELQIEFSQYEHPVVMTVEAQAKYVGNTGGGLLKIFFLKDKKNRFYVVSALVDTKVDLKVLSQRLGLGKGGLRMAPEEALGEILQFQPAHGEFKFGFDRLSKATILPDTGYWYHYGDLSTKMPKLMAKAAEPSRKVKNVKDKPVSGAQPSSSFKDVGQFLEEILDKTSALLLSEITEDTIKEHGERLGAVLSNCIRERLSAELKADSRSYLNAAYTEGFSVVRMMFQNTGAHDQFRCFVN